MPFLAAIPAWVGTAAALTGAAVTGVSAIASGYEQSRSLQAQAQSLEAQGKAARYNRQVMEMQAEATEKAGEYAAETQAQKGRRLLGAQRASFGAAGVEMAGTPLEVMAATASDLEMEAIATRYNYGVEAARYRSEGSFYGYEANRQSSLADYTRSQTSLPIYKGYLGAGTSLLTTAGYLGTKTAPPRGRG